MDSGGVVRALATINDGKMKLNHVETPTSAMDAANRLYVDQEIAKAHCKSPERPSAPSAIQLEVRWWWRRSATRWLFFKNGNNYYLSLKSNNGLIISSDSKKSWNASGGGAIELSVWRPNGSLTNEWKMIKHSEVDTVYWQYKDGSGNYCLRFHCKWHSNDLAFTSQTEYFITVGGFL